MKRHCSLAPMLLPCLVALIAVICLAPAAPAGPNAGGTILVHYTPVPVPPEATYVDGGLAGCLEAVTQAPVGQSVMWFAYAAFPQYSSPRLKVVTFACQFDDAGVAILWTATRPGAVQIFYPDQASWPYPGSGVAVGFLETLTEPVDEIYCFAGYGYSDQLFALVAHPDQGIGGTFADDSTPSNLDLIAGYGSLGFGMDGVPVCPPPPLPGACCYEDGTCGLLPEGLCIGDFQGENTVCEPNPCPQPPQPGACCFGDGSCMVLIPSECLAQGGQFFGGPCDPYVCSGLPPDGACCFPDGTCLVLSEDTCESWGGMPFGGPCDPSPCPPPSPTETVSWGRIKAGYR